MSFFCRERGAERLALQNIVRVSAKRMPPCTQGRVKMGGGHGLGAVGLIPTPER